MKIIKWFSDNILFVLTLFLLAFIPLYPKIPLFDVRNTWVYIRAEDFVVTFIVLLWTFFFLLKKVKLKTPLTLPIMLFWIIGGISTLHGVLLIFPTLANVFSNVAFLSFLRRIEYLSLFFISFSAVKDKKFIPFVTVLLSVVLLLIVGYGAGQKFYHFPAYLTMNEEFAKGVPIQLSELSRVPSTFAGHYDLAAYLVLIVPLLTSMVFGARNMIFRIFLLISATLGFALLFTTVSRVSFFVLLLSLVMLFFLQKKRPLIISLLVLSLILLIFSPSLIARFGSTVSEVDVLVDAKTGADIGHVKDVPSSYFSDKIVLRQPVLGENVKLASSSAIVPLSSIPAVAPLVIEQNAPTGENLPQGTGYINLALSPVTKKIGQFFYQKTEPGGKESKEIQAFYGEYIIKRAKAYDLSFTTRFQGEWPKTMLAFQRNILLGSGYGSVSLAVDNNYLRILGEVGLLGFASFLLIFLITGIYIKRVLPDVDSPLARSFVFGFIAGTFGLALNAVLIDVFEASKIAFTYWLLMGVTLGMLQLYKKKEINFLKELKGVLTSTYAVVIYLLVIAVVLFSSISSYYFVGDDFTWFRWVSDCCNSVIRYFTESNGFFYRPGAKLYFSLMYSAFWLNQTMYHFVSILLHFTASVLVFLIAKRVLKKYFLSVISAVLFLFLSAGHEAIFWISSTGFLFNAVFVLLSLLFFIYWKEKKRVIYFILLLISIILSLLFHELGIIAPLLVILYDIVFEEEFVISELFKRVYYLVLLSPILPYLALRYLANSHWLSGDYSYNLLKLPYNFFGNTVGYVALALFGPASLPLYQTLRNFSKQHAILALLVSAVVIFSAFLLFRMIIRCIKDKERRIVIFGLLFFLISLLPFLGLGNITSRYSYLAGFGLIILFLLFFKKTYEYLTGISDRYIATAGMIIIAIVFLAAQLFQLQKLHTDWQVAGEKVKRFLISLDYVYAHFPQEDTKHLFFVDVPIRFGEAWVFPVGLSDAVSLVFRNENIRVYQVPSVSAAFRAMGDSRGRVFKFDNDGSLIEMRKLQSGKIEQIPIGE